MISTYVAVWAANEEKIETAQHEDYFKNAYEWCKEKALLISIDPVDSGKIARSHRHTSSIDVTAYYTRKPDSNKSMNSSYQVRTRRVKIQFGRKEHGNMRFPKVLEKRK